MFLRCKESLVRLKFLVSSCSYLHLQSLLPLCRMLGSMLGMSVLCPQWIVVKRDLAHTFWYIFFRISFWWSWSVFFLVELNDESGNPIWKNRVESWKEKDKKNKKKKSAPKAENEAPIPQEQQMEEIQWVQCDM